MINLFKRRFIFVVMISLTSGCAEQSMEKFFLGVEVSPERVREVRELKPEALVRQMIEYWKTGDKGGMICCWSPDSVEYAALLEGMHLPKWVSGQYMRVVSSRNERDTVIVVVESKKPGSITMNGEIEYTVALVDERWQIQRME